MTTTKNDPLVEEPVFVRVLAAAYEAKRALDDEILAVQRKPINVWSAEHVADYERLARLSDAAAIAFAKAGDRTEAEILSKCAGEYERFAYVASRA